ncbi:MAG TPA: hypothetical protein VN709_09715 [Terriglobales bacterium]|nr:hypothetical protein [Terriglobales bacterium]
MNHFIAKHARQINLALWLIILIQVIGIGLVSNPITADSPHYRGLSQNMLSGNGYSLACDGALQPEGWRPPGYPLFLSAVTLTFGPSVKAEVACQLSLYLAAIALLFSVARRFSALAGAIFLAIAAIYPAVAYSASLVMAEAPTVFLITGAVYLLISCKHPWAYCLAGAALGLSALCRAQLLPLGVVVAIGLWIAHMRLREAILVAACSFLVLAPYATWNLSHFGRFTPVTAQSGSGEPMLYAAWEARIPSPDLVQFANGRGATPIIAQSGMLSQFEAINAKLGTPAADPAPFPLCDRAKSAQSDKLMRAAAFTDFKAWPGDYIRHYLWVGWVKDWIPTLSLQHFQLPVRVFLLADTLLVLFLGFAGSVFLMRSSVGTEERVLGTIITSLICYFGLTIGLFVSQSRNTIPVRLLLLLAGAAWLGAVFTKSETNASREETDAVGAGSYRL